MTFTVASLRDKIHDITARNPFLQDEEFTDGDLELAISQAVSYWNSMSPLIEKLEYTTETVPDKYSVKFLEGAVAVLLSDKAKGLIRNKMPAAVEGVGIDINARATAYSQISDKMIADYMQWIIMTKRQLASLGILSLGPLRETSVLNIVQDTEEDITVAIVDAEGESKNVETYDSSLSVYEYVGASSSILDKELTPSGNTLTFTIEEGDFSYSGVYQGEISLSQDGTVKFRYPVYVNVEKSLEAQYIKENLTLSRLRNYIMDRAGESYFISGTEFSDADLARSIIEPVNVWNTALPVMYRYTYSPITFPEEYITYWEDASAGYLFRRLSYKFLRNGFPAGEGSPVDTTSRANLYTSLGENKIQAYLDWVKSKKYALNISSSWGTSKLRHY